MLIYIIDVILCKTAAVTRADFTEVNEMDVPDFSLNGKKQSKNATDCTDSTDFSGTPERATPFLNLCNP
jgi:hypothetical protein